MDILRLEPELQQENDSKYLKITELSEITDNW